MVRKLVSVPPSQRSVTNGILLSAQYCSTAARAWRLVPTKHTSLPLATVFAMNLRASRRPLMVSLMSMIEMPFFVAKMYGFMRGFQFERRCPKMTPASTSSFASDF